VIALGSDEDLRLVLEAAERLAVRDAIAVALEGAAQAAGDLGHEPAAGLGRAHRQRREAARLLRVEAKFVDAVMAYRAKVRVPLPHIAELPRDYKQCCEVGGEVDPATPVGLDRHDDFVTYLADRMLWFLEWSHIDGAFDHVLATVPGMSYRSTL